MCPVPCMKDPPTDPLQADQPLLDALFDTVLIFDANRSVTYANPAVDLVRRAMDSLQAARRRGERIASVPD